MKGSQLSPETLVAQALGEVDPVSGALTPSISLSTNFEQAPDGTYHQGRVYTRADNPTYEQAERMLAMLEGAAGGCILFASGMAAAIAVFQSLIPGDHVVVSRMLYWGVRKWLAEFGLTWGLDVEFVDMSDLDAVHAAIRPGATRLVWLETPANPTWEIADLRAVCALAHAAGARVAVDNTVPTPVLTRPIEFGADLVVHSATKYLNGHSDVLAGAVLSARNDPFWQRIRSWRRTAGAVPGPFETWLLMRGMRTLFLRVRRSSESALAVARHFEKHPALRAVLYPGLPSHPGHATAARQMRGASAACCRSGLQAAPSPRGRCSPQSRSSSARRRSAAPRASSSIAAAWRVRLPRSRRPAAPVDRDRSAGRSHRRSRGGSRAKARPWISLTRSRPRCRRACCRR
jgi:cystathionine gamma-synthase